MGAITEGVVAGLQLRQRKQEFAAAQQQQAEQFALSQSLAMQDMARKEREARLELESKAFQRGQQMLDHLNTQRDRIADDRRQTMQDYFQANKDLDVARASLNAAMSFPQGDPARVTAEQAYAARLQDLQDLRGMATDYTDRLHGIDAALMQLSAMSPPDSGGTQAQPAPSGGTAGETPKAPTGEVPAPTAAAAPTDVSAAVPLTTEQKWGPRLKSMGIQGRISPDGQTFEVDAQDDAHADYYAKKLEAIAKITGEAPPVVVNNAQKAFEKDFATYNSLANRAQRVTTALSALEVAKKDPQNIANIKALADTLTDNPDASAKMYDSFIRMDKEGRLKFIENAMKAQKDLQEREAPLLNDMFEVIRAGIARKGGGVAMDSRGDGLKKLAAKMYPGVTKPTAEQIKAVNDAYDAGQR